MRTQPERHVAGRLGGTDGNEILTSATALVLIGGLAALGITLLSLRTMLSLHMLLGVALLPPIALKLGSTGYRFARYYTHSRAYRAKGPPLLPMRLLAPLLVAATIAVFATGIALLAIGHRSGTLNEVHKVAFIAWAVVFGIHFLVYLPRAVRSLAGDWSAARRREVGGAGPRAGLVLAATACGAGLAVVLAPAIHHWHRGPF